MPRVVRSPAALVRLAPARRRALLAGLMLALAGCAPRGQEASQPAFTAPLPPAAPRAGLIESGQQREHRALVQAFGGEYRYGPAERYLGGILARISTAANASGVNYRVTLLNSAAPNAFALPSGDVYVTRGLLALANDSAEIAAVLAHEIAHVTARHADARQELERRSTLITRVATELLNDPSGGQAARERGLTTLAGFSRQQELEADTIGVQTMARAGFDPNGAARFLTALGRSSAIRLTLLGTGSTGADIRATHPNTPERVAAATATARQVALPGSAEADRDGYLAAIEGMMYGDDPARGAVRGRAFRDPAAGIGFDAPDGFTLENGQALIGVHPSGRQALRFEAVELDPGQTLEAFVTSGWIEGVATAPAETISLNGLPAATATATGRNWNYRFVAVRGPKAVYRLIYAVQGPLAEADSVFRASMGTIRAVRAEEAARPLTLTSAVAGAADTAESLAARMRGVDRPLERFLVLNGLDRSGPLVPGRRYKLVTE